MRSFIWFSLFLSTSVYLSFLWSNIREETISMTKVKRITSSGIYIIQNLYEHDINTDLMYVESQRNQSKNKCGWNLMRISIKIILFVEPNCQIFSSGVKQFATRTAVCNRRWWQVKCKFWFEHHQFNRDIHTNRMSFRCISILCWNHNQTNV